MDNVYIHIYNMCMYTHDTGTPDLSPLHRVVRKVVYLAEQLVTGRIHVFVLSTQTICQKTQDKSAEYFSAVWALHAMSKVDMLTRAHLNDLTALCNFTCDSEI